MAAHEAQCHKALVEVRSFSIEPGQAKVSCHIWKCCYMLEKMLKVHVQINYWSKLFSESDQSRIGMCMSYSRVCRVAGNIDSCPPVITGESQVNSLSQLQQQPSPRGI